MELPGILGAKLESWGDGLGLVPEHTILPVVRIGLVMDVERSPILRHGIHDRTERSEIRDDARIVLPQHLAIPQTRLPQDERSINAVSDDGSDIHTIL